MAAGPAPDDAPNGEVVISYPVVLVTVTGGQVYGSSAAVFTASYAAPGGVTVSGTVTCTTVNGGTLVTPGLTAGGSYTIDGANCSGLSASAGYAVDYVGGAFTVTQAGQVIGFTAPATAVAGTTATLAATGGDSGNPVVFTVDASSGAGVCDVSGDTVSYLAGGTCVVDANQAGSTDYSAAAQVQQAIEVQQAPAFTADDPPLTAAAGTPYSCQFAASGVPEPAFTLGGGAPSWLTVGPATGLVSGTPPSGTGSFSYPVTAANSLGSVTTAVFTVTVSDQADVEAGLSCPSGLAVDESGTCTLTVTNAGPALAVGVLAGAVASAQLRVTGCSGGCSRIGGVLAWSLGSLPAGQSVALTISVTGQQAGAAVVAAVGSASSDPDLFNNLTAATVAVTRA